MNNLSHGFRYIDRPWFLVGTALPDWLAMIDRKVRVREKYASSMVNAELPELAELAQGIVQHHRDDHWFHQQPAFVDLNLHLSLELRDRLGADAGFRPHFAAHVIIEMLLDATLDRDNAGLLDRYYSAVRQVDPALVQLLVNRIAPRTTRRLADFIPRFIREKYLYDYATDPGILYRINRILAHLGLPCLPASVLNWLPQVRSRVETVAECLLAAPGVATGSTLTTSFKQG